MSLSIFKSVLWQSSKFFSDFPPTESQNAFIACPAIFSPIHGYLECSRPINTMKASGRVKITNLPGTECKLKCPVKYKIHGNFHKTCDKDGKWIGDDDGFCSST